MIDALHRYLLPGLVFQGIVIGGGYATGRELVEFFLKHGALAGLLGMLVTTAIWSFVMAVSFELCRVTGSYDYRHFFQRLLGRGWVMFEGLLIILMVLVLAVVASAAGEIVASLFGWPNVIGILLLVLMVGSLATAGRSRIERFMESWSVLLYVSFATLVVWSLFTLGPEIERSFETAEFSGGWFYDGVRYAGYNLAVVPLMLFCLKHLKTRRQAVGAGLLAGPLGMLPAMFLFIALLGVREQALEAPVPSAVLLAALGSGAFGLAFQLVLFGTLVQTGIGMINGVNERIAGALRDNGREMPHSWRGAIALLLLASAITLASAFGIVQLIARGYGLLTFGFIIVFVVPVLTVGLRLVILHAPASTAVASR